jgi:hypothetical protein
MTVAELIEELKAFPPEMPVYIPDEDVRGEQLVAPRPGIMYVRPGRITAPNGREYEWIEACNNRHKNAIQAVVL